MPRKFIAGLKEGDACLVENLAEAGQEIYPANFIEPATIKFLMGNSIVVAFDNPDNRFQTPTMSFGTSGVIERLRAKPVRIRLLEASEENRNIIERHQRFQEMQASLQALGALQLNRNQFMQEPDEASRELLAQLQAVEMLLTQLYVTEGD